MTDFKNATVTVILLICFTKLCLIHIQLLFMNKSTSDLPVVIEHTEFLKARFETPKSRNSKWLKLFSVKFKCRRGRIFVIVSDYRTMKRQTKINEKYLWSVLWRNQMQFQFLIFKYQFLCLKSSHAKHSAVWMNQIVKIIIKSQENLNGINTIYYIIWFI